jgi:hypothetical protein
VARAATGAAARVLAKEPPTTAAPTRTTTDRGSY